jgi:hypothetical protein
MQTRRGLITGLISFVAAPAIVRASSLMPISVLPATWSVTGMGIVIWFDSYGRVIRREQLDCRGGME